jgi:ADP-ribosylation factor protein 1
VFFFFFIVGNRIDFTFWDLGGCDKIRPLFRHYFEGTDLLLFVLDSQDIERLNDVKLILNMMDELPQIPVLFIAHKQDLENAKSKEELVRVFGLQEIKDRKAAFLACSSVSGLGMDKIMDQMCLLLSDKKEVVVKEEKTQEKTILETWLEVEDESDDEFLRKLHDYSLDKWDHRTHLRIAWIYLTKFGRKDGMKQIFSSIKNFIANCSRSRKTTFNETMTYFWYVYKQTFVFFNFLL